MKKLIFIVVFGLLLSNAFAQTVINDTADYRAKTNLWVAPNGTQSITAAKLNSLFLGSLNSVKQYTYDSIWVSNDTLFCRKNNNTKFYTFSGSGGGSLPSQTGNAGKFLGTNGSSASWLQLDTTHVIDFYKKARASLGNISLINTNGNSGDFLSGDGTWRTVASGGGAWGSITGTLSSQNDLQSALDGKSSTSHTHTFSSLTSVPTTLSGYGITDAANSSHTHTFSSLTSKPTTLAGYGITDNVTTQGNTFNGINQLVQLNGAGALPAIDGGLLTGLTKSQVGLSNVPNTDATNASNITSGTLPNARLSAIPNSALANNSITINGSAVSLGGSVSGLALASDSSNYALRTPDANVQTASYTLALSDVGKIIEINNASAVTVTIPPNSSVAFPIGTIITVVQRGDGIITATPGSGVTVNSWNGWLRSGGKTAYIFFRKISTNTWDFSGQTMP